MKIQAFTIIKSLSELYRRRGFRDTHRTKDVRYSCYEEDVVLVKSLEVLEFLAFMLLAFMGPQSTILKTTTYERIEGSGCVTI